METDARITRRARPAAEQCLASLREAARAPNGRKHLSAVYMLASKAIKDSPAIDGEDKPAAREMLVVGLQQALEAALEAEEE